MRIRPAYRAGRGRDLNLPLMDAKDYMNIYYPPEYGAVRQNTQWENTLSIDGVLKRRKIRASQYEDGEGREYKSDDLFRFWLPSHGK